MKERCRKKIWLPIGILLTIIVIIVIFFNSTYSKTKREFTMIIDKKIAKTAATSELFTEEEITSLPLPVQKYFRNCGYIGTPKMTYMKAMYHDVDFSMGKDKPNLKMDYTQYNFVDNPARIAYIDSSLFGIPYEGLDAYVEGAGSMKGVIAKLFVLFNQRGGAMDKASLVTCLSECLVVPRMALQDYIIWEGIDDLHAKATIYNYGISASGIFTFDENGEMQSFTTDDREAISPNGTSERIRWSAICSEYKDMNGIKVPTVLQAVWHYEDGDLVYFDGKDVEIEYGYENWPPNHV